MKHYGASRSLCGAFKDADKLTEIIRAVGCPDCLVSLYRPVDDNFTTGYYDRDANKFVTEPITHAFVLPLAMSSQCAARGAFQTESGNVYAFTIRRHGHGDIIAVPGHELLFIATPIKNRSTYNVLINTAGDLLELESQFMAEADRIEAGRLIREAQRGDWQQAARQFMTTPDTLV